MAVWVVLGGPDGEFEEEAIETGTIAIRYGDPADLRDAETRDDTIHLLRETHPSTKDRTISMWATSLWAFRESMKPGDLIVMPRKENATFAIGEIAGECEYLPELPAFRHKRAVRWLNTEVPKDSLESDLWFSILGHRHMIYQSRIEKAEERLRHVADTGHEIGHRNTNNGYDQWDTFISWAKLFYEWEQFDERERQYKLEIAEELAAVKQDFRNRSPDWEEGLKKVLVSPSANNLTRWSVNDYFIKMDLPQKEDELDTIWGMDPAASIAERVRRFQQVIPGSPANKTSLASLFLMADGATQYPPYRYTPLLVPYRLTGYPAEPNDSHDIWERYEHALGFWDEFIKQASSRGLQIKDRLDAQGLVWCVTHYGAENMPDDWPEEVKARLIAYREGNVPEAPPPLPPVEEDPWSQSNITTLAQELLWQPGHLQEIIEDLQEKRQVIFYGPPGTGKTYVAREIAKQCKLNGGDFEIVQFHPSYSYEDFVQGFRPKLTNGQPGFDLVDGPLRRIADKAKKNRESTFILIIDELNRGNVAKVFGELYFLLEYRDEEVRLQYGGAGEGFSLPSNLWFICTMNTADRSIALMDAALRRRFYFAPFFPDEPPIEGLLRRWLERKNQDTLAADLVDVANKKLERDMGIGPSYFMRSGQTLDETRVHRIWDRAVIPYIEEQFFGDADKLDEFAFDRLKRQSTRTTAMGEASDQATANNVTDTPPENDDTDNTC